jgi:hypothetical protein
MLVWWTASNILQVGAVELHSLGEGIVQLENMSINSPKVPPSKQMNWINNTHKVETSYKEDEDNKCLQW